MNEGIFGVGNKIEYNNAFLLSQLSEEGVIKVKCMAKQLVDLIVKENGKNIEDVISRLIIILVSQHDRNESHSISHLLLNAFSDTEVSVVVRVVTDEDKEKIKNVHSYLYKKDLNENELLTLSRYFKEPDGKDRSFEQVSKYFNRLTIPTASPQISESIHE